MGQDWLSSLTNSDKRNQYTVTVINKFNSLRETSKRHNPNNKWETFLLPTKPWVKCKVQCESKRIETLLLN